MGGEVGSTRTTLVVLRGNSGSGKSSVAARVRARRPAGSLCVIGQDNLRRTVLGVRDRAGNPAVDLVDLTARFALDRGLDVLVEGILFADHYGVMLRRLVEEHRGTTRCFLYDVSLEETLRRHATKTDASFGDADVRAWWHGYQPVEGLDETRIPQSDSLDDAAGRLLGTWAVGGGEAHP